MSNSYSRRSYLAIAQEATENLAVTPSIFVPMMSEDLTTEYNVTPANPVSANRALNLRDIPARIPSPAGTINLLVEPRTYGHFLKGCYGSAASAVYMPVSNVSAAFQVGETITGGTSSATGVISFISSENDYLGISVGSGTFESNETITGGTSSSTATVGTYSATVNVHEFRAPQNTLPSYTIEIGYHDRAIRYMGTKFHAIETAQSDEIITAAVSIMARSSFESARITSSVDSGSGLKTINLDQTSGLVVGDTIKVYREGSGYLDFASSGTQTHTIGTIPSETSLTVTNLVTALQEGDLIVIAPQTPTYTIEREFSFIGGTNISIAEDATSAVQAECNQIEDFTITLTNNIEERHAACGAEFKDRFTSRHILAGLEGSGSFTRTYTDPIFLDYLRRNQDLGAEVQFRAQEIGATGIRNELNLRIPNFVLDPFNANIEEDAVVTQEMPFTMYDSSESGYFSKAILINEQITY